MIFRFFFLSVFFLAGCVNLYGEISFIRLNENSKTVTCFVYHRFGDKRYPTTNVPVSDFEQHLRYLKDQEFQVLTFSQAIKYLKSDEPAKKTAVVTIDDGYKSFFNNGFPLLKKYKMTATLFINTETIGSADLMDWTQLKEVVEAGIEIGNHTHSHSFFLDQPESTRYHTFKNEIEKSQAIIKANLNLVPSAFTYPYGEFDDQMKQIVREAGFSCAAAQNSGVLYEGTDLFQIPRFPMSESYSSISQFAEKIKMKPFKIINESPSDTYVNKRESRPELILILKASDLQVKTIKGFVQGGNCDWNIIDQNEKEVTIKLRSSSDILKRRRTLYTITAIDKSGTWRWYSHLWINSGVRGE